MPAFVPEATASGSMPPIIWLAVSPGTSLRPSMVCGSAKMFDEPDCVGVDDGLTGGFVVADADGCFFDDPDARRATAVPTPPSTTTIATISRILPSELPFGGGVSYE